MKLSSHGFSEVGGQMRLEVAEVDNALIAVCHPTGLILLLQCYVANVDRSKAIFLHVLVHCLVQVSHVEHKIPVCWERDQAD